jgi:hypothetical protein
MKDRRPPHLETESGMRPRSAISDRVLVGLAGIALIGGMLIAVGNVLRGDHQAASASLAPPASQSGAPGPTPPPLQVVQLEPGTLAESPTQFAFTGWVRAKADMVILASPELQAPALATLRKGELAYAAQHDEVVADPPWLSITEPEPGWIRDANLVIRYGTAKYQVSSTIYGLAAGPDGFLALGHPPDASSGNQSADPIYSSDGIGWRVTSSVAFGGWDVYNMTSGPAGWLVVGHVNDGQQDQVWLWNSSDGLRWQPLGGMGVGADIAYPEGVVASADGYLLTTHGSERSSHPTFWFSADGTRWQETADPNADGVLYAWQRTIGIPDGFYLSRGGSGPPSAVFSVNGRVWAPVEAGPDGQSMQLIETGSALLAIDADPSTAAPRVWVGQFDRRHVAWHREAGEDPPFAGAVVTALVWDGQRAYAFGWDRSTAQPLVWTRDVVGWTRAPLPDSFGGFPQSAAAGPTGVVVIGHRPTLRGDNPIMWHRTVTGYWLPEPEPLFEVVPNPTATSCPSVPRDLAEFMVLDTAAALVCFGHAPITMRAWSVGCPQCYGSGPGQAEPAWLMAPSENQLFLSPIEPVNAGEWWTSVVLAPSVVVDRLWSAGTWVELTGHFDDPAAATCHYEPAIEELPSWSGQQSFIDRCRQTFVVTDVKVVRGP